MSMMLTERYQDCLAGVLSCYDRIVITGTLPGACYAAGMTSFLNARQIRIFDYARFAEPLRDRIRAAAQTLAAEHGVRIEHIAQAHVRKEDGVAAELKERGDPPGRVHVLSAMEACPAYEPWHDQATHRTFLRPTPGKCLHYYFYFMDETLGLIYLRVPTGGPFRLQFYCNGHSGLARALTQSGIGYATADNAFLRIEDWERAQALADGFSPDRLHALLDPSARLCCPVLDVLGQPYHWSLPQVEYSTDWVFRSEACLKPLYENLSRQAIFSVKAEQISNFLGKKITPQLAQEIGSRFSTRIEGRCIKHRLGSVSVKMYDKFSRILRLETTVNDVSFFKHFRKVEHRDGRETRELAPLKKTIYSLPDLRALLLGCNRRSLEYLSALDDFSSGNRRLARLVGPKEVEGHTLKGFNFFHRTEQALLRALQRPEFNLHGIRRADLQPFLPGMSPAGITRQLWRLRAFGLLKKVAHSYRYYLTRLGRAAIAAACRLTEQIIIHSMATIP